MENADNRKIEVLTIEDEQVVRTSIKNYLEDFGYLIHEASDGQQGLDVFNRIRPDVVLIDLRMPVIDGLEVLDNISRKSPDTPAIIISGTGVISEVIQALKNGAWDFLQKPIIDLADLKVAIDAALERSNTIKENRIYKAKLENEVRARTNELSRVNSNLEAFNYSISNALNVPLRHIEGFSAILAEELEGKLENPSKQYLDSILKSVSDTKILMKKLLQFSQSTHEQIILVKTNLKKRVERIVNSESDQIDKSNINYIVGNVAEINTDITMINLVLENLLSNATFYCSRAESPTVEFGRVIKEGETIYFVKDNGIGINPKRKEKIFAPFHSFHTDSNFEGVGLGLAISRRIIERLGGRIWAESEEGKGATFFFTLPQNK